MNAEPLQLDTLASRRPLPLAYSEPRSAQHSRSGDLSGWADIDPVPVLLIGPGGTLLESNASGARLLELGPAACLRGRALAFIDQQAQQSFQRALMSVISRRTISSRLILRGNDGCWRQVDILSCGPDGLERAFVRFPTEPQPAVDINALVQAFGMSAAESEVLRRLLEGLAPKEIARTLCMSTNTVRSHLRMLYLKMNARGIPGLIRQTVRLTR